MSGENENLNEIVNSDVSGGLSIREVGAKYGEKVECMFYDYDNEWRKRTMVVNATFIRDMERGVIKDCR